MFQLGSLRFTTSVSFGALALALVASASPAQAAADACGTPSGGVVECDSSDAPFPTGIEYDVTGDLTVDLEDGLTVAPDAIYSGIIVSSSDGSVVISGAGADVTSEDAGAIGAFAAGDLTIAIDDVATSGTGAWGITTFTFAGDTVIEADTVTTNGDYGLGIVAESGTGSISISVNNVDTAGFAADGITVRTGGDINVEAGSIQGEGDYVWGVNVTNGAYVDGEIVSGHTNIDVGSIEISGDHAVGVNSVSYGTTDIKVDSITISGDNGIGVRAIGVGDVNVEVGDVTFTGQYTGGILAFSYGEASVKVGNLTAENGGGVVAFGVEGAHAEAGKITISGDYANGIQSVSQYGDATLKVGEVSTNGFFAVAVNGDALKGDLVIEAGKITTQGELAMGIRAFGRTSLITVTGPISTNGDEAFGILNATTHGDAVVRTSGAVSTTGTYADALWITGRYGTADIKAEGKITTTGDDSRGIYAIGEDGQVKVVANDVETSGADSDGIKARTRYVEFFIGQGPPEPVEFTGDIDITAETVKVTGAGSMGITARGLGKATIDAGTVTAFDNYAIETNMIEDATITVRKAATSTQGSAIFAEGEDVTVNVASGANVSGGEHGIIVKAMGDRCVMRNPSDGSPNPCPNPGDEWGNPNPELAVLAPVPPGTATINNAGTIKGGSGYAIKVEVGSLTLNNSGTILGAVLFGEGDDIINNSGTFEVTKDSDFGAGNDLFKNTGTVKLATATAPKSYKFLNLEKFENSGTVDLRNGAVGDAFTLSGNYVGSGNATLGLDVNLANSTADKFVVAGSATGSTKVVLALTAEQARLTSGNGIALVEVGAGSSANAFTLAQEIGFISYGLAFDSTARRYLLQGVAGSGAYRQLNAFEGAESAWHASANAWRSNDAANRDAAWAGLDSSNTGRSRLWGQIYGERTSRDAKAEEAGVGGNQLIDYRYEQDRVGAQLGYDLGGSQGDQGSFRFGVTGGYANATLESRAVDEEIRLETFNVGAYAGFSSGPLWGTVLAKYDWHKATFDSDALGFDEKVNGSTWGIEAEAGARFGNGGFFVEPLASLAWTQTDLDELEAFGQVLDFDQADGLRGKIGARVGGRSELGNGDSILFYGSAKAVHDFGKKYRLTLVSGGQQQEISAERVGTFGEGVIGLSYLTRSGLEGFLEGQGELGSEYDSFGGRAGMRFRM